MGAKSKTSLLILLVAYSLFASSAQQGGDQAEDDATFSQAVHALDSGDLALSETLFVNLIQQHPDRALYWFNLGNVYYSKGNSEKAVHCYTKVIRLKSALTPVARLYAARALRNAGHPHGASRVLLLIRESSLPRNIASEVHSEKVEVSAQLFQRGIDYYRSEDFVQAYLYFDTSARLSGDAEATAMRGMTLLKLNRLEGAKEAFASILQTSSDAARRDEALYFLELIRDGKWRIGTYWAHVEVAPGYDSNLFYDAASVPPTANSIGDFSLTMGVKPIDRREFSITASYNVFWEEAFGVTAGRIVSQTALVDFNYYTLPWSFKLSPVLTYQELGEVPTQLRAGASLFAGRSFGPHHIGIRYMALRDYASSSIYDYLAGTSQMADIEAIYDRIQWSLALFYRASIDNIGDQPIGSGSLPAANWAHGPGATAEYWLTSTFRTSLTLSYLFANYLHAAQPGNLVRTDGQLGVSLKLSKILSRSLWGFVSFDYLLNQSTLGANSILDRNYNQLVARTGITWDIVL